MKGRGELRRTRLPEHLASPPPTHAKSRFNMTCSVAMGSVLCLNSLLKNIDVEGLPGHELSQALVLLLECSEFPELTLVHSVVHALYIPWYKPPRLVGLPAHADLPCGRGSGGTFYAEGFHLAGGSDDLLWGALLFLYRVGLV